MASSTCQAQQTAWGPVRLSWAGVDHPGALHYRVSLHQPSTGWEYTTAQLQQTYADLDPAVLAGRTGVNWRVEVSDSADGQTRRNRRNGAWMPLAVQPYDPAVADLWGCQMRRRLGAGDDDGTSTDLWFDTWDAYVPPPTYSALRVELTGGPSWDLLTAGNRLDDPTAKTGYSFLVPGEPAPGLYTFRAFVGGKAAGVAYDLQPQPVDVPGPGYATLNAAVEPSGNLRLTWAPVEAPVPVWYMASFYTLQDHTGDGDLDEVHAAYYLDRTSWSLDPAALPDESLMVRLQVRDAPNGSLVTERANGVFVGWEGPGADYAAIPNDDGDDLAANVDPDDQDPAMDGLCLVTGECPPAKAVTIAADPPSPSPEGGAITFTAQARVPVGRYEYRWWQRGPATANLWKVVRNYATDPTWQWTPAFADVGSNKVRVQVRRVGTTVAGEVETILDFAVAYGLTLTLDPPAPREWGAAVTASCGVGLAGDWECRFLRKGPATGNVWQVVQNYGGGTTWLWNTAAADSGLNQIKAQARRVGSGVAKEREVQKDYRLLPKLTVSALPASPSRVGVPITFTGSTQPANRTWEYRFMLRGPATNGQWVLQRNYTTSPDWMWTPPAGHVGVYKVKVRVREAGSGVVYETETITSHTVSP